MLVLQFIIIIIIIVEVHGMCATNLPVWVCVKLLFVSVHARIELRVQVLNLSKRTDERFRDYEIIVLSVPLENTLILRIRHYFTLHHFLLLSQHNQISTLFLLNQLP
jgi:hypothetical protein